MVGPVLKEFTRGLALLDDSICIEDNVAGVWRYADGHEWKHDRNMTITCIDNEEVPECVWNEGVRFIGGDMTNVDGKIPSFKSAEECREACDAINGCRYWSWKRSSFERNCWVKK